MLVIMLSKKKLIILINNILADSDILSLRRLHKVICDLHTSNQKQATRGKFIIVHFVEKKSLVTRDAVIACTPYSKHLSKFCELHLCQTV